MIREDTVEFTGMRLVLFYDTHDIANTLYLLPIRPFLHACYSRWNIHTFLLC